MRPVKLVFEGIRSYRTRTEVDFTDLSLFALIGDTGAGKSSIIEALCLALYGGTTWSGRNVNELMSDNAERMAVELTFTANGDTWIVTRGHRRAGGAATHKLTSAGGERVDGADAVNRRIQTVLGLTKDQFLRAVVMPQGRFEELLKATPGQRTDILKGIFRLQVLDGVRRQVGAFAGRWREPIARLEGERLGLPADPAAALAGAIAAHEAAAARAEALDEHTRTAEALEKIAAEAERLDQQIGERAERATRELSAVAPEALDRIAEEAATIDRQVDAAARAAEVAAAEAEAAAVSARAALGGFASRDDAVTALGRLHQAAESLAGHVEAAQRASEALAVLEAGAPPIDIDARFELAVQRARAEHGVAEGARRDAEAVVAAVQAAYATWTARRVELAAADAEVLAATGAAGVAAAAERKAEVAAAGARDAVAAARAAHDLAVRTHAAAAASGGCEPGDDCPVCARPLPPTFMPPAAADLDRADTAVAAAVAEADDHQRGVAAAARASATAAARSETAQAAADRARAALAAAEGDLGRHLEVPVHEHLGEAEAITGPATAADGALAAVAAAAATLAGESEAASQARADLAATRSRWDAEQARHRDALERANGAIARTREELGRLPERWRLGPEADPAAIAAQAGALDDALAEHAAHMEVAGDRKAGHAAAATRLLELDAARAATVTQPVAELVGAAHRARAALAELATSLAPAATVPAGPPPDGSLAAIAESVNALHAAATGLAGLASIEQARLRAETGSRNAELAAILTAAGVADLGGLRGLAGGARSDATHAHDELTRVGVAAARADQIDDALRIAGPFLAALDALNKLLADGRFIGHLVREREVALLTEASRVLRSLSADRFGFGDGFKVIDRHSGQERGPDTLSGGERFQASLALALALVEIATRSGGQLEAVFVDEGFGSLDAASLDQALTTLGAVASDGKLVALVSHLRQVAEYVDQVLLVERDDVTGSRVRPLDQTERDTLLAEDARSRMTG